jgi:hypothetical protein
MTTTTDPIQARRTDPLTRLSARYPHESASPADYARAVEGPLGPTLAPVRGWLHWLAVAVCAVCLAGAIGIFIAEVVIRRAP